MTSNLLNYTREQIQQFVKDGICPMQTLRDYDVLTDFKKGKKIEDIAFDNNVCRAQAYNIRSKYAR